MGRRGHAWVCAWVCAGLVCGGGGWEWEEPRRPWFGDDEVIYRLPLFENVLDFFILLLNHLTTV